MWAVGSSPPPLQLVGSLPNYDVGQAYEGRLDILNNIGPCGVEIVWEESFLPPGSAAVVDMDNLQVVVTWPAFTPPEEIKTTIVNGDFQAGTLEGWNDLRGASWGIEVYDQTPNSSHPANSNPFPPPPGNLAAYMRGFGRGDHILESDRYPVQQGQPIMARSLWDQGPSNKDNNNLWTALGLYRDGQFIEEVRGDRIHDRTNKSRHWSTVNHTITGGVDEITVRLIAHRRNGRNRPIIVDNVETSGLTYTVGQDKPDEFYTLTLRLWDSAGRVAYWSGIIASTAFRFLTSGPYPVIVIDSFRSSGAVSEMGGYDSFLVSPYDDIPTRGDVLSISMWTTQEFHEYAHIEEGSFESRGETLEIAMWETTVYKSYSHVDGSLSSFGLVTGMSMEVTTNFVSYENPSDSISSAGAVLGLEMQ